MALSNSLDSPNSEKSFLVTEISNLAGSQDTLPNGPHHVKLFGQTRPRKAGFNLMEFKKLCGEGIFEKKEEVKSGEKGAGVTRLL
jgi:hypothetical protein